MKPPPRTAALAISMSVLCALPLTVRARGPDPNPNPNLTLTLALALIRTLTRYIQPLAVRARVGVRVALPLYINTVFKTREGASV